MDKCTKGIQTIEIESNSIAFFQSHTYRSSHIWFEQIEILCTQTETTNITTRSDSKRKWNQQHQPKREPIIEGTLTTHKTANTQITSQNTWAINGNMNYNWFEPESKAFHLTYIEHWTLKHTICLHEQFWALRALYSFRLFIRNRNQCIF